MVVAFFKVNLKIPYEQLLELRIIDETLNLAITEYARELEEDGLEIWKIEDNIAITDGGYYVALENTQEIEDYF